MIKKKVDLYPLEKELQPIVDRYARTKGIKVRSDANQIYLVDDRENLITNFPISYKTFAVLEIAITWYFMGLNDGVKEGTQSTRINILSALGVEVDPDSVGGLTIRSAF